MLALVLDETVVVRSLESERTLSRSDLLAAEVVLEVQDNHTWIMTWRIESAYRRQFSRFYSGGITAIALMKSLNGVLLDANRMVWLDNPPEIEGSYDPADSHVVAAAGAVKGCLLVTGDEKLVTALHRDGIPATRQFEVVSVAEAIRRLRFRPG